MSIFSDDDCLSDDEVPLLYPELQKKLFTKLRDRLALLIDSADEPVLLTEESAAMATSSISPSKFLSLLPLQPHKEELIEIRGKVTLLIDSLDKHISAKAMRSKSPSQSLPPLPQKEELIQIRNRLSVIINSIDEPFNTKANKSLQEQIDSFRKRIHIILPSRSVMVLTAVIMLLYAWFIGYNLAKQHH